MDHPHLVSTIGIALTAAFAGGVVARRLKAPVILGYLIAGVLIAPSTPGIDLNLEIVQTLAELGVAFLMFSLGVEFSLRELLRVRRIAVGGGAIQIVLTLVAGFGVALLLGWSGSAAVVFGMVVALGSSAVAIKMLMLRGEMETRHGRATGGVAIFQDLALVPMLVALPIMASSEGGHVVVTIGRSVGIAAAVLAAVLILGLRLVPALLELVERTKSRELFVLSIIVIALGAALVTERAGLSIALGAFLAGLIVSESDFSHQVLADITPLRDAFATLFFVSIGMLLDLDLVGGHLGTIIGLVLLVVLGKTAILAGVLRLFRLSRASAVMAGVLLAQVGEVSFIVASEALGRDIIADDQYRLILALSLGTLIVAPLLVNATPRLLEALPARGADEAGAELSEPTFDIVTRRHTIICGYGRIGSALAESLHRRGFQFLIVDYDLPTVRSAQERGFPAIFGDAGNPDLMAKLGVARARALAVAISDPLAAEVAVAVARRLNPRLDIIARSRSQEQMRRLRELGADEVVQPEFEAGLELVRYMLHLYGLDQRQIAAIVQRRRSAYYEREETDRAV